MNKLSFNLEDVRVQHLSETDPKLKELITSIGAIEIPLRTNFYKSLVNQIIGQQLSLKAAKTISNRLEAIWEDFNPELLSNIPDDKIRGAGISFPKLKYIKDLTQKHLNGEIDLSHIDLLNDEEVINILMSIKGVGKWTAEMFLIFSLGRLNILSYNDVSINNAIRWLFQIEKEKTLCLNSFKEKWEPYNTIASLYLWKAIDLGFTKKQPNEILHKVPKIN